MLFDSFVSRPLLEAVLTSQNKRVKCVVWWLLQIFPQGYTFKHHFENVHDSKLLRTHVCVIVRQMHLLFTVFLDDCKGVGEKEANPVLESEGNG